MKYNIASSEGQQATVTVFIEGESYVATKENENFATIVGYLLTTPEDQVDTDYLVSLFDIAQAASLKFERLSERVTAKDGHLYFDGDEVTTALAKVVVGFYTEGLEDWKPLVNFMEKIATNPNEHSRENLYRWLSKHDFSIDADGNFYAYKAIDSDGKSRSRGSAIVNGEWVEGRIPNSPGDIIEMPRGDVAHNPAVGCSTGLHAGTWSYARSFITGGTMLLVKINPRDVVSVPTDSGDQKLRTCRYTVVRKVTESEKGVLRLPRADDTKVKPRTTRGVTGEGIEKQSVTADSIKTGTLGYPSDEEKEKGEALATATAEQALADEKGEELQVELPTSFVSDKKTGVKDISPQENDDPYVLDEMYPADFKALPYNELRRIAKELDIKVRQPVSKGKYVRALSKAANAARKENDS